MAEEAKKDGVAANSNAAGAEPVTKTQAPVKAAPKAAKAVAKKKKPAVKAKKAASPKKPAKKPAAKKPAVKAAKPKAKAKKRPAAAKPALSAKQLLSSKEMEQMMKQGKTQFDQIAKDATDMSRENMEAWVKSSTIFAKGCEDIVRTAMSLAQASAEKQTKYVQQALSSKTINEWSETQNKIAQANFDDFMSNATKISEMSVKVLNESIEPINEQATKTVQKATESMAA